MLLMVEKLFLIVGFQDQARHVILIGRNERVSDNFLKWHIGQRELGRDAFLLGPGGQPGQLVARLFFIGLGKNLSQVTELKAFGISGWYLLSAGKPKVTNRKER